MNLQTLQIDPAVSIRGLTKRYGKTTVVDQLDLTIPRGSFFGLIGPNGAGKSTTLKMLMGMLSITEGTAETLGENVLSPSENLKSRVGYVPETHHIYRWMKIREVISFARSLHARWNDSLCASLLQTFNLDQEKRIKGLSKGMLAKLALLLAISHEPELLILDEPMSGLDPVAREEFLDGVLETVCQGECTVILSSHTIEDVQRLSDSIGLLNHGRMLVQRPVDEILVQTKRIRAVLADEKVTLRQPESTIWQRVQKREWLVTVDDFTPVTVEKILHENPIDHVEVEDLSLEEIFKDYVKGTKGAA